MYIIHTQKKFKLRIEMFVFDFYLKYLSTPHLDCSICLKEIHKTLQGSLYNTYTSLNNLYK